MTYYAVLCPKCTGPSMANDAVSINHKCPHCKKSRELWNTSLRPGVSSRTFRIIYQHEDEDRVRKVLAHRSDCIQDHGKETGERVFKKFLTELRRTDRDAYIFGEVGLPAQDPLQGLKPEPGGLRSEERIVTKSDDPTWEPGKTYKFEVDEPVKRPVGDTWDIVLHRILGEDPDASYGAAIAKELGVRKQDVSRIIQSLKDGGLIVDDEAIRRRKYYKVGPNIKTHGIWRDDFGRHYIWPFDKRDECPGIGGGWTRDIAGHTRTKELSVNKSQVEISYFSQFDEPGMSRYREGIVTPATNNSYGTESELEPWHEPIPSSEGVRRIERCSQAVGPGNPRLEDVDLSSLDDVPVRPHGAQFKIPVLSPPTVPLPWRGASVSGNDGADISQEFNLKKWPRYIFWESKGSQGGYSFNVWVPSGQTKPAGLDDHIKQDAAEVERIRVYLERRFSCRLGPAEMVKEPEISFPIIEEEATVLDAAAKAAGVDMWIVRGLRKSRGLPPIDYFLDHSAARILVPGGTAEAEARNREAAMRLFTGWAKSDLNEERINGLAKSQQDQFSDLLEYAKLNIIRDEKQREFEREQKALDRELDRELSERGPRSHPLPQQKRGPMELRDAG